MLHGAYAWIHVHLNIYTTVQYMYTSIFFSLSFFHVFYCHYSSSTCPFFFSFLFFFIFFLFLFFVFFLLIFVLFLFFFFSTLTGTLPKQQTLVLLLLFPVRIHFLVISKQTRKKCEFKPTHKQKYMHVQYMYIHLTGKAHC